MTEKRKVPSQKEKAPPNHKQSKPNKNLPASNEQCDTLNVDKLKVQPASDNSGASAETHEPTKSATSEPHKEASSSDLASSKSSTVPVRTKKPASDFISEQDEFVSINHGEKKHRIATLKGDTISDNLLKSGEFYELSYLEHLKRYLKPGDFVLDIGAHIGNHTLYFSKVCGARVVAFEANPIAFVNLRKTITENKIDEYVSAHNIALSDGNKKSITLTPLPVGDPGTMSAYRKADSSSIHRPAQALDDFFEYFKERPIRLIKIDVEKSELDVLAGGEQVIRFSRPVIGAEVMDIEQFRSVDEFLSRLGYQPVSIHNATPTVIWDIGSPSTDRTVFEYAIKGAERANALTIHRNELLKQLDSTQE